MRICSLPHVRATEVQSDQRGKPNSFRPGVDDDARPQSAVDELLSAICLCKKEAYLDVLRGNLLPDFTEQCSKVKVPTLVMCGRQDLTTPVAMTNELTRLISGAIERIIPAGHLGCFDDPAAFNKPIIEFLDALPR